MSTTLRLASINLLHGLDPATGAVDTAGAAAAVGRLGADVVALQEVDRGQPRSGGVDQVAAVARAVGGHGRFAAALIGDAGAAWEPAGGGALPPGAEHAATAADAASAHRPAYGVGLVSRWPVLAATSVPLPGGGPGVRPASASPGRPGYDREPRVALRAVLDVGGRCVVMTTTHLSYLPWRGARQLRAVGAAAIAERHGAGAVAWALLGDLNLPVPVVRALARGWRHAGGAPTFPAARPRWQPDQLLVRGSATVDGVGAGPRLASDHRPLVARLALG